MPSVNKQTTTKLPEFPEFIPFSKLTRAEYEDLIHDYEPYSDYGYTSLYAWGRQSDQGIAQLNGNIVLSMQDYMSDKKILSFLGTNEVNKTVEQLLDYAATQDEYVDGLYLIPEISASKVSGKQFQVTEDRDNHDYILDTSKFIELEGPEFAHVRRKVSQFHRRHGKDVSLKTHTLSDPEVQTAIKKLSLDWAFMGTEGSVSAHEEIAAISRILSDIKQLNEFDNIHCLALYQGNGLEGFCIFETQKDYAIVHFIKSNLRLQGSSDVMMIETMRHIANNHGIVRVNHEQDLGIEGLRRAKEHYNPVDFLKKFTVRAI